MQFRRSMVPAGFAILGGLAACCEQKAPVSANSDSGGSVPLKFSPTTVATTNKGTLNIHGPFTNDSFTATAENLPPHDLLEVEADLIVTLSWDGSIGATADSSPNALGPDYIKVSLSDGRVLLYNTFSNANQDFNDESRWQNYPSQVPGDHFIATTGATGRNTLGFAFTRQSTGITYPMDTTYHIHFVVPHTEAAAALTFAGFNLQEPEDENWCVANVKIRESSRVSGSFLGGPAGDAIIAKEFSSALLKPTPTESEALAAPTAFQSLISDIGAVDWIEKNITAKPISAADATALMNKIAGPGDTAALAEAATKLAAMGPQTEVLLRDALRKPGLSAEGRDRLEWQLQVIGVTPIEDEDVRKVMLATRALELIGTPKALAVRKQLTQK